MTGSALFGACAHSPPQGIEQKSGEIAQHAYTTGCLQAYQRICSKFSREEAASICRDEGLNLCEDYGKKFRNWMELGNSEPTSKQ